MATLLPRVVTKAMSPLVPGKAAPATLGKSTRAPSDAGCRAELDRNLVPDKELIFRSSLKDPTAMDTPVDLEIEISPSTIVNFHTDDTCAVT